MHRDLKLGLALAVLLIGSTTAFFFRGEADQTKRLPELGGTVELDKQTAARRTDSKSARSDRGETSIIDSDQSPWRKPAFLNGSITTVSRSIITPDPIPIPQTSHGKLHEPSASLNDVRSSHALDHLVISTEGERFYVVQPGDTLSGLAARYLGSIARFDELFELNRDVLRGPHDLKIGMKLRLPSASTGASLLLDQDAPSVPVAQVKSTTTKESLPSEGEQPEVTSEDELPPSPAEVPSPPQSESESQQQPESNKLFVPARKTPFIPSRYRSPSRPVKNP